MTAPMEQPDPIACHFCDGPARSRQMDISRVTPDAAGVAQMHRIECECGAISRWRPTPEAAIAIWNAPYQLRAAGSAVTEPGDA